MRNLLAFLVLLTMAAGCEKTEDDSNNTCTSNCTTLRGKFVSLDNAPVPNVKISLTYRISGGELGGGSRRLIADTKTGQDGNFDRSFFIKDSELGNVARGYFMVDIDDSNLDVDDYIRTNNLIGNTTTDIGFAIYDITTRDTIIEQTFYIPKKAWVKVHLNGFIPVQADDYFEVQTLYPFGAYIGINTFLNSPYSTGFSGYGNWRATGLNNDLEVFVAEGETNVIRIFRRKNGVNTIEEFPMVIPPNNSIELTYQY